MRILDKITHCHVEMGESISLTLFYDKVTWITCDYYIKVYEDGIMVFEIYDDEIIFFNQLSSTYSFTIKAAPKDLDNFREFIMEDFEECYFPKPGENQDETDIDKVVN